MHPRMHPAAAHRAATRSLPLATLLLVALVGLTGPRTTSAATAPPVSDGLRRAIAADPARRAAVWVRFTDRAGAERDPGMQDAARRAVSARSLARRALRGVVRDAVVSDLPVHEGYVQALVARGARLRGTSRWLNAASVEIPVGLADEFARLPFVAGVSLVPKSVRARPVPEPDGPDAAPADDVRGATPTSLQANPGEQAWYGGSFKQLDMMQVPALHALGLSGAGILVTMLDGGFETTHQVFTGLDIVATRDFVHGDLIVSDQVGQDAPGAQNHGSWTLGCVAGRKPGTYAGGAYNASVALGKTEDGSSETPVEEDYWQFGAEWADSLGADIIASSLTYTEFDDAGDSYTYADLDGRTTVVTLAAAEAARRGILVVNSAGNYGSVPWFHVGAPADADSIVAVGAVDSLNVVASFSSHGPTADGRIKPDVTAMGVQTLVIVTSPGPGNTYSRRNGTSFSSPLVAGLAALLLESHPTWTPVDVRNALRRTALNAATPNNTIGWGLVRGLAANAYNPSTDVPGPDAFATLAVVASPNPLRAGGTGVIRFAAPASDEVALDVVDVAGRARARLYAGAGGPTRSVAWSGRDADGAPLAAGLYWIRLTSRATAEARTARVLILP